MSTLVCLDVVREIPGGIRTIEPILHWTHADNFIAWFENHLPWKQMDFGPFYEFAPETMDEFIGDCQKALEKKGWFFEEYTEHVDDLYMASLEQYRNAVKILTKIKMESSGEWKSLWFFYSVG